MQPISHALEAPGRITGERFRAACGAAIGAALGLTEPMQAIEAALGELHDRLDGALAAVLVLEHDRLWLVGNSGHTMIPEGFPSDEGVVGRTVGERAAQLVLDVSADADFIEIAPGVVSELSLPLVANEDVVGVLNLETFSRLPGDAAAIAVTMADALCPIVQRLSNSRHVDLSTLARLFVHLSSLRDPLAIAEVVVRSLPRVLPVETSQLLLRDEAGVLVDAATWRACGDAPEPLARDELALVRGHMDPSAVFELLDGDAVRLPLLAGARIRSAIVLPLRTSGEELGLLVATSRFGKTFDRTQAEAAALLAAHTAASLDAAVSLGRERRSALTDPLTGLLNRRGLEERLERELQLAQTERSPLSVIVLDCDDFKDVNDRAGHEFGDALLREIGHVLAAVAPDVGCAARLGGDEFIVVLPATAADVAEAAAYDVQGRLAAGLDEAGFPLHLSAGVSTYPYDGAGPTQLLRSADQALYEAKARGKDRVVGFRELLRRGDADEGAAAEAAGDRRRGPGRPDASMLESTMEAAGAIWQERTPEATLDRLAKALTFVVGAIATQISRVDRGQLVDVAQHKLRDIDLGDDLAYLIDDFPVTKRVLETGVARALSFLDDDLDPAEAFVLREVGMNCCLLLPLHVHGGPWGLVELYDMRLRRFTPDDRAVAEFLVQQAARRLESFGELDGEVRRLRLFRVERAQDERGSSSST